MNIDWTDFFMGFAVASLLAMFLIRFTWSPMLNRSNEVARKALACAKQNQETALQYKAYVSALYFALCEAKGQTPDPYMVEFFGTEPPKLDDAP